MAGEKRYYWLKLNTTYFNHISQKKMRRQEHGKEMQIIYLRLMLYSLDNDGYIFHQGVYDTLSEELAEEFDEPEEIIKMTIEYLITNKMLNVDDEEKSYFVPEAVECVGSETAAAARKRKSRKRDNVTSMSQAVTSEADNNGQNKTNCDNHVPEETKHDEPNEPDRLTEEEQKAMIASITRKLAG